MVKAGRAIAQRRSRAALIWAVALFVTTQFGLALAIVRPCYEIGDPFFAVKAQRLHRVLEASESPHPLVLMLGSSRAAYGFDAARFERDLARQSGRPISVFNFGTLGAGPVTELLYYRRLGEQGLRPAVLLIEVMPPFLAGQLETPPEAKLFPAASRLAGPDLALLRKYGMPTDALRRTRQLSWTVPGYAHRAALLSRVLPGWLPYQESPDWAWGGDGHGWTAAIEGLRPEQYRESLRVERQRYAAALTTFRADGAPARALRELLSECRQQGVKPALVLMPEGSEFRRWYPVEALAELDALLNDLGREFGVPRIDGRRWVEDADFFDAHHLRARGAEVFSNRLRREVMALGLLAK